MPFCHFYEVWFWSKNWQRTQNRWYTNFGVPPRKMENMHACLTFSRVFSFSRSNFGIFRGPKLCSFFTNFLHLFEITRSWHFKQGIFRVLAIFVTRVGRGSIFGLLAIFSIGISSFCSYFEFLNFLRVLPMKKFDRRYSLFSIFQFGNVQAK